MLYYVIAAANNWPNIISPSHRDDFENDFVKRLKRLKVSMDTDRYYSRA